MSELLAILSLSPQCQLGSYKVHQEYFILHVQNYSPEFTNKAGRQTGITCTPKKPCSLFNRNNNELHINAMDTPHLSSV